MRLSLFLCLGACALVFAACPAYVRLTPEDQEDIAKDLAGKEYFLKHSCYFGPFFVYEDRFLLMERAFDERVLVQTSKGAPMLPGEPLGVLPMGTRVKVREIQFPTSKAVASRRLESPRSFTWVLLDSPAAPDGKPLVLVLMPEFEKKSDFGPALETFLVAADPRPEFADRPEAERAAIDQKKVLRGMRADALIRSRGYPDRITRSFENGVKVEKWQYAPSRSVTLRDDRVEAFENIPVVEETPPKAPAVVE
ncbi:MAG: hypothetical protein GYA21_08675 [Myxococcales bacterium]|nr:hypothetical protein [Myxococcales bacterium]